MRVDADSSRAFHVEDDTSSGLRRHNVPGNYTCGTNSRAYTVVVSSRYVLVITWVFYIDLGRLPSSEESFTPFPTLYNGAKQKISLLDILYISR
jgi:hypothetical protein